MTKRDRQASEYAAESYDKTPAERGVSATFDLISDATDFLLEMATRRVARTHYEGCRKDHVECLVAALVDAVTRLRDATPTTHATPAEGSVQGEGTVGERLVERFSITHTLLEDNEKLRAEIARLRLTAEEREAIEVVISAMPTPDIYHLSPPAKSTAAILRNLLERLK